MPRLFSRCQEIARAGAATFEFAFIVPILILFLIGIIELGKVVKVQNTLDEAARAGCRVAVFEDGSKQDVIAMVASVMEAGNITHYSVEVTPNPSSDLGSFEPVTVRVTLPYQSVSWVSCSPLIGGSHLSGACVMPSEVVRAIDVSRSHFQEKENSEPSLVSRHPSS